MVLCRFELALVCLMGLALIQVFFTQNFARDYLSAHNRARAQVGVGPMEWDRKVAAFAQTYANHRARGSCQFQHSGGPYGENLALGPHTFTGKDAVNMWVAEKQFYNHKSNSCIGGIGCRHYTQVVWRRSIRLGCARVRCDNDRMFIICNYDPPGNVVGQRLY